MLMTLRTLTFIVLIPVFIITFLCVWIFFTSHYQREFETAEQKHLAKQQRILVSYAEKSLARLSTTSRDWAMWDDSYAFMQDKNSLYITSNLVPATLNNLNVDGLLFFDNGMNHFHSLAEDAIAKDIMPLSMAIKNSRKDIDTYGSRKLNFFFVKSPLTGAVYAAVFSRITDSNMTSPPAGFVVILLTLEHFVANAYDDTGFVMLGNKTEKGGLGQEYFSSSAFKEKDFSRIELRSPVVNTGENLLLSFRLDRSQFIFVEEMLHNTILAVMGFFVLSAAIVTVLMNYFVMRKISLLTTEFKNIEESTFLEQRLPETGVYELKTLAKTANAALDDIRDLNKKLLMMTNIDGLTGIPNRRFFDVSFDKEFKRALRNGLEISIIMIDIDHFKKFNDTYGHINGDECLKTVAGIIAASLQRPADFTARFGGEEFIVILPETGKEGAKFLAEAIRKTVKGAEIKLSNGTTTRVTISLGISTSVPNVTTVRDSLIENADIALYTAKRARDCVRHFGEESEEA